jgi:multisubunit Na+/H+ antiporter MnhB subunit
MWVGGMLIATGILLVNTLHRHRSWGSFAIFEVLMLVVVTLFVVAMYSILWMSQGSPPHSGLRRRK